MTREEAIDVLEKEKRFLFHGSLSDKFYEPAFDMAIEALQEPEQKKGKWIVRHRHEPYPSGRPYDEDVCPFCKRTDHNGDGLYCGYCGAKMDGKEINKQ